MYTNIEEIKEANHRAGRYFFSPNTMKSFKTKVLDRIYGGKYFITSDQRESGTPREYTIWEVRESGDILKAEAPGVWYKSSNEASKKARELALVALREYYRKMRTGAKAEGLEDSYEAYNHILISLDNARSAKEACEFLNHDIRNTTDQGRKLLYYEALDALN